MARPDFIFARNEPEWGIQDVPAAATQATITRPAESGRRHIVTSITISVATGATASGIIQFRLLDGSTVIWSCKLSAIINDSKALSVSVNILGTVNALMRLQSTGAGAATSEITVAVSGYTI